MSMANIKLTNVGYQYDKYDATTEALENVSFSLTGEGIVGLLGRNGAGKTTLLSLIASFRRPTSGTLTIDGEDPYENATRMEACSFIWENQQVGIGGRVGDALRFCKKFRPNWDDAYVDRLLATFGLSRKDKQGNLSKGMRAALNVVCGLAARAPITIFDEAYLGMDAVYRKTLFAEILNDYMEHPRLFILSTHHIEEVENLLEHVLILRHGHLIYDGNVEDIRTEGSTLNELFIRLTGDGERANRGEAGAVKPAEADVPKGK
jgi:ABC-2 type transport system ATP-binding protein